MIPHMWPSSVVIGLVGDHLWQSTLVAAAAALIVVALTRNAARVRYWLWLAASVKFLVPFAVLTALGRRAGWFTPTPVAPADLTQVIEAVSQPFSVSGLAVIAPGRAVESAGVGAVHVIAAIWVTGCLMLLATWLVRWRRMAKVADTAAPITSGPVPAALRRLEAIGGLARPLAVVASAASLEPGVFGIRRPVLLWPQGIETRLSDAQVEGILAHEVAHVRRRDNLTAAVHMLVEALFWFHPLVWWIGARLVHERERACDEDVVRLGIEPHVYAEGILRTCQFYVESPLACVAGVTGSDLARRIEVIMRNDSRFRLSAWKRALLACASMAAVMGPIAIGVVSDERLGAQATALVPPPVDAPTFEAASIRPTNGGGRMGGSTTPGRFTATGLSVRRLIRMAYDIHDSQIVGGPDWPESQGFDITATITGDVSPEQRRVMMRTLLRDRFSFAFHTETRELPIYALVVARSDGRLGSGLRRIPDGECPPPGARRGGPPAGSPPASPSPFDPNAQATCGSIIFGPGRLLAHGVPIDMLARSLANLPAITSFNRIVQNQTGLDGTYDFDFKWTNEFGAGRGVPPAGPPPAPAPGDEPTLVTALQEQLGLKLDARRATVQVMAIDAIERPTEN